MPASLTDAWTYLEDRFGVDKIPGCELVEQSGDYWITATAPALDLVMETHGFRFIRVQDIGLKPTTYALQFLDDRITRNRVDLSQDELRRLLDGDLLPCDREHGYVALVYRGQVIGCGLSKDGAVSSRIPKGRATELQRTLGEQ